MFGATGASIPKVFSRELEASSTQCASVLRGKQPTAARLKFPGQSAAQIKVRSRAYPADRKPSPVPRGL